MLGLFNARCLENEGRRVGNGCCMYDCVQIRLERTEKQAKQASEAHWREYVSGSRATQHGRSRKRAHGEEKEEAGQPQGGTRGEEGVGALPTVCHVEDGLVGSVGARIPVRCRHADAAAPRV